jgi:hypothetical protein
MGTDDRGSITSRADIFSSSLCASKRPGMSGAKKFVRIDGVLNEIRTKHFSNTSQESIRIDLKGFWRWCMLYRLHRIFLDFFHHHVFKKTRHFGNWIRFRPQVKVGEKRPTQLGPLETSCFLAYRTMEKSPDKFCEFCTRVNPFGVTSRRALILPDYTASHPRRQ